MDMYGRILVAGNENVDVVREVATAIVNIRLLLTDGYKKCMVEFLLLAMKMLMLLEN